MIRLFLMAWGLNENILEKRIRGEHIFFTDETKIDMAPFLNDSIRLSMENQ